MQEVNGQNKVAQELSIGRRIGRYWFHYVIIIPALLLLLVFKGIPAIYNLIIPFKDYNVIQGIANSQPTGLRNFAELLETPNIMKIIINTFSMKFGFIVVTSILAFAASLVLSSIGSRKWKGVFSSLFVLPYFIPECILTYIAAHVLTLGSGMSLLAQKEYFRPVFIIFESLRYFGIPAAVALSAIEYKASVSDNLTPSLKMITALKVIGAFALIQLSSLLTLDFDALHSLSNPLVYETAESMDTYLFKTTFVSMKINTASALGFLQFVVQIICTVIAYMLLKRFFKDDLFKRGSQGKERLNMDNNSPAAFSGAVILSIFSLAVLAWLFVVPWLGTNNGLSQPPAGAGISLISYVSFLLITLTAVVLNLFVTVTLAYPLTVPDLPGRRLYKCLLLFVMVMGGNTVGEFLYFRQLGMLDTVFPHIIIGMFNIMNIFVLKSIFNGRYGIEKKNLQDEGKHEAGLFFSLYIPRLWKVILSLGVIQFITLWNSYRVSLIYSLRPARYSPAMYFYYINSMMNGPVQMGYNAIMKSGMVIALPSILLFLLFRRYILGEVLIGKMRKL